MVTKNAAAQEEKPEPYRSAWKQQLEDTMNRILNREPFTYHVNGDALYQQYRDQAIRNGQMAMMDTMGASAALTGGYHNSYAQTAAQQAYQQQLQGLNDRVPELYSLALSQYDRQGKQLQEAYALLSGQEQQDYSRYRDRMNTWQQEEDRRAASADKEADRQALADYRSAQLEQALREFAYRQQRDQVSDEQWQTEFDENLRRYTQQWAAQHPEKAAAPAAAAPKDSTAKNYNQVLQQGISMMKGGGSWQDIQQFLDSAQRLGMISDGDKAPINRAITEVRNGRS